MGKTTSGINKEHLMLGLSLVFVVALIYSRFVITICMIGFLCLALFSWDKAKNFPLGINPGLKEGLNNFWKNKAYLAATLIFFIVLFSGVYSEDTAYWLERVRIKIPFLLMPLVWAILPPLSKRSLFLIHYFLMMVLCLTCVGVGGNYFLNQEVILQKISEGQAIPTPMNHIRFSLLIAYGVLSGLYLYRQKFKWRWTWESKAIALITIFLFAFLHFLSVRSGLVVMYVTLVVVALHFIITTKRWRLGLVSLSLLIAMPFLAYKMIPSFKAKVLYMEHDWHMYLAGEVKNYSDGERWVSTEMGYKVFKDNPWLGVGAGDLKKATFEKYQKHYPDIQQPKMPHNQYLSIAAGSGLLGMFFFFVAVFTPLFYRQQFRNVHWLSFHILILLSFCIENTIENAVGVAFYSFFLVIWLNSENTLNRV